MPYTYNVAATVLKTVHWGSQVPLLRRCWYTWRPISIPEEANRPSNDVPAGTALKNRIVALDEQGPDINKSIFDFDTNEEVLDQNSGSEGEDSFENDEDDLEDDCRWSACSSGNRTEARICYQFQSDDTWDEAEPRYARAPFDKTYPVPRSFIFGGA